MLKKRSNRRIMKSSNLNKSFLYFKAIKNDSKLTANFDYIEKLYASMSLAGSGKLLIKSV